MKTKLLSTLLFFILTSTQLQARPSLGGLEQKLGQLINALVACPSNAPTRFVDNGDGTVCDHQTGLMWEKKNASDGAQNFNSPRDVDNSYTWQNGGSTAPNGTAFTDFLPRLNGELASGTPPEQLGGHSDWRLPTIVELQTIMDCSFSSPCISPVFGPTATFIYWSSTHSAGNISAAWLVNFDNGIVGFTNKGNSYHVRAVRGGRSGPGIPITPGPVIGPVTPPGPLTPLP